MRNFKDGNWTRIEDVFPMKKKVGIFHCYVRLPEGSSYDLLVSLEAFRRIVYIILVGNHWIWVAQIQC